MFTYNYSSGDPEGTTQNINFVSEIHYTKKEFTELCEEALLEYGLKKKAREDKKKKGYLGRFWEDWPKFPQYLIKYLKKYRLEVENEPYTQSYYLEPYWGLKQVKNKELKKLIKLSLDG